MSVAPAAPAIEVDSPVMVQPSSAPAAHRLYRPRVDGDVRRTVARPHRQPSDWTRATFAVADVLGFAIVAGLLWIGATVLNIAIPVTVVAPLALLVPIAFAIVGLYKAACIHPADELELVATMSTLVCLAYAVPAVAAYAANEGPAIEAIGFLAVTWALLVGILPGVRATCRVAFSRFRWWGTDAIVLAQGKAAEPIIRTLKRWPELGLNPVAVLRDGGGDVDGVPVCGQTRQAARIANRLDVRYAILAMPGLSACQLSDKVRRYSAVFERVLVVPTLQGAPALWASGRRPEGLLGYGVSSPSQRSPLEGAKRGIDIALTLVVIAVLALPLLAISIAIKLDSPGPVLFRQTRLGKEGRCFTILKFRSMYTDADARLQALLEGDPARREEYECYRKLRDDPRVTPVGRFIRKYSLDELPQLLNVIRGDLSLVGPRAYLPRELPAMGGLERAVLQLRPGVTGLWQVSGRNELAFSERLSMDAHYVQHWTPWLDLYILAKTLPVVLTGEGAR